MFENIDTIKTDGRTCDWTFGMRVKVGRLIGTCKIIVNMKVCKEIIEYFFPTSALFITHTCTQLTDSLL